MSTSYKLTIRRAYDRKIVAASIENCVKSILSVDDEALPTDGTDFKVSDLSALGERFLRDEEKVRSEIERMREGVFKCKSVEVKHDIEADILWKQDELKELKWAYAACWQLIGVVDALSENMLIGDLDKDDDSDDGAECAMAYKHYGVNLGKNESGYDEWKYCWADDAILSLTVC